MKNIILCFDGTNNEASDAEQDEKWFGLGGIEDSSITNVLKLHLLFGGNLQQKNCLSDQMSFYYSGVGTYGSWIDQIRNMALAPDDEDVGTIIKRAVRDLYNNYSNGDKVFIFGFSRGAAIARRFSSVLNDTFPALGKDAPNISFMGLFDTVAAINKPNFFKEEVKPASDVVFENRTISPLIDNALHLLSLDDRRIAFFPTLMNKDSRVTEVWFTGAHSDVGGGYNYDGLSDQTLQFMLDFIERNNFGIKTLFAINIQYDDLFDGPEEFIKYHDVIVQPDYLGKNHQQHAITKLKKAFLGYRKPRVIVNDITSVYGPVIHYSVIDRIFDDADYNPESLRNLTNPYIGIDVGFSVLFEDNSIKNYTSLGDKKLVKDRKLKTLKVNEQRDITVHSNQKYNPTRILVHENDKLIFSIDDGQLWYDATIECGPDGWKTDDEIDNRFQRWAIKLKEDNRRHEEANWFEMLASINRNDENLIRVLEHNSIGNSHVCTNSGELFLFANDLKNKYGNNRGTIKVTIKRIK